MTQAAERVVEAIKASGVRSIAIIDDAFDAPVINDYGPVLTFLEEKTKNQKSSGISDEVWMRATAAVRSNEYDDDAVDEFVGILYQKYVESIDSTFDPGGVFKSAKGPNLAFVRPIVQFLKTCPNVTITTLGIGDVDNKGLTDVGVVFVDLYLHPDVAATGEPDQGLAKAAIKKSLERVQPLMGSNPSVILMSSHGERGKKEADAYRESLDDKIYASRFSFVDKGKVQTAKSGFTLDGEAADTLLDIFQSYKFGRGLSKALDHWLASSAVAVTSLGKEIRKLQLKDMAYLVQFRLSSEGQDLEEYLEWFFGECLLDQIGHEIGPSSGIGDEDAAHIEGTIEPTEKVARMYHQVRIESARPRPRKNFRLGDLYLDKAKGDTVVAVMTPDCDLMLRKNGKRGAQTLLTVAGELQKFEEPSTSMGDFIIVRDEPYNIVWNYKSVQSYAFKGAMERAGCSGDDFEYLGALRPMYAQEIQAHLLNHLGRVGVSVPPVIGMPATAKLVILDSQRNTKEVNIALTPIGCSYLPPRASQLKGRAVFSRPFIRNLVDALLALKASDICPTGSDQLGKLQKDSGTAFAKKLRSGLELESVAGFDILVSGNKPTNRKSAPWCVIYIEPVGSIKDIERSEEANFEVADAMPSDSKTNITDTVAATPNRKEAGPERADVARGTGWTRKVALREKVARLLDQLRWRRP